MGTLTTAQIQLTEAELKLLQTLVYQECGMYFDERRSHFLKDRLQRRLKACQLDSFYSYYRLLTSREGRAELALLLENLTVNETSFVDRKVFEQKCKLSAAFPAGQQPVVRIKGIKLARFEAALEAVLQEMRAAFVKIHAAFLVNQRLQELQFRFG